MENRGRQSVAELSVISGNGIVSLRRPDPPSQLTPEQAAEWVEIVNRLSADHFPRETHGMLMQYCRHMVCANRIASMIEQAEGCEIETYDKLTKMQEREGRAISSLATRMRLSQQSTTSADKKKPALTMPKPWEQK